MTILIVDDNETNRKLLHATLEAEGHRIIEAVDGVEAIEKLKREKLDAVISDILMPRMDGYRLCREVRRSGRFGTIPFVFLTSSYTSPSDAKLALELGADDFLQKPASAAVLVETLQRVMKQARASRPVPKEAMGEADLMREYSDRLVEKLERKNIELLLHATALETAANAIVITDNEGTILWVNPAFTRLSGYELPEVIGQTPRLLKSGLHGRVFYSQLWEHILAGATWRGEFINRRKDGSQYRGEQTITPVRVHGGPITHFIGIMTDVTDRWRAQQQLQRTHDRLQHLLEHSPVMIYSLKFQGEAVIPEFVSENITRLLGFTVREACSHEWWMRHVHPDDLEKAVASVAEVLSRGSFTVEYRVRHKDGRYLWVEDRRRLLRDASGAPSTIMGAWTDINERKTLETQFLRAQRMESIGTLAGGIAHDLNNALTPITMAIDFLKLKVTDKKCQDVLATIASSAKRGAEMVSQVLTFARGMDGRRTTVQVRHLILDMEKMCRDTFPKNITIHATVAKDLWPVDGDATQLHQVLLNLCVNARDAMPGGGQLKITAENVTMDEASAAQNVGARTGPHLVIHVEDTGDGMPPPVVERIFDPFFTTKEPGKGTGLGLSTTLSIVKSHGGFIRVESEPGRGTHFRIHLPAQVTAHDAESGTDARILPRGNGETILVVDDEDFVRQITRQTLEAFGYHVMLAADGAEAVTLFSQHDAEIHVVLTDIMMPVMDGFAAMGVLKRIKPDIRLIASSGITFHGGMTRLASAGVKHFLPKPYTTETLLTMLREVLDDQPSPAAA